MPPLKVCSVHVQFTLGLDDFIIYPGEMMHNFKELKGVGIYSISWFKKNNQVIFQILCQHEN